MKNSTQGLTLLETMVAVALLLLISSVVGYSLLASMRYDASSNRRGLALEAAQTWLDRYRARQEPSFTASASSYGSGGMACTTGPTAVNCQYSAGYTYPASDWPQHSAQMATMMSPFRHVINLTFVSSGANFSVATLQVQTFWKENGIDRSVTLATRINY